MITIQLYYPHDRFSFGWEYIGADDNHNYSTFSLFLGFITIKYDNL